MGPPLFFQRFKNVARIPDNRQAPFPEPAMKKCEMEKKLPRLEWLLSVTAMLAMIPASSYFFEEIIVFCF